VRFAEVTVPERVSYAVAALDLDDRVALATARALANARRSHTGPESINSSRSNRAAGYRQGVCRREVGNSRRQEIIAAD